MLELKQVSKVYKTKHNEVRALDKVDLYFEETGLVFITGKSGSGKTTLLNVIGGLDNFDEGEILIQDKSTKNFSKSDFDSYRNTYVGFVFQEYNLLDSMTIQENLYLATQLQGLKNDPKKVAEYLEKVDLRDILTRRPMELSGGQKQRVAIARALVKNPAIIMADEPTGALDTENGLQVMEILKKLSKEKLVIVVSHELELANKFADRVIYMEDGHVKSDITIEENLDKKMNVLEENNSLLVRRGADLKEKDLLAIKKAVKNKKDVSVSNSIDTIKRETKIDKKDTYSTSSPFIKTHLCLKDTLKLGFNTLKAKPFRLAITIILCAIAFAVFGLFDSLAIYDESRLAANTLKASNSPSVTLTTKIQDGSTPYEINVNNDVLNDLSNKTGYSVKGIYRSYFFGNSEENRPVELSSAVRCIWGKYYFYKGLAGAVEFDSDDLAKYKFKMYAGKLPENYNEIAISKYYANCMVNWVYAPKGENQNLLQNIDQIVNEQNPYYLTLGPTSSQRAYKIVGIVDCGDIDKRFDSLKPNINKSEPEQNQNNNQINVAANTTDTVVEPDSDPFEMASTMLQNAFKDYIKNSFNLYGFMKPGFANNAVASYDTLTKYPGGTYYYRFTAKDVVEGNENAIQINTSRKVFYDYNEFKTLVDNSNVDNYKGYFFINPEKQTLGENEIILNVDQFQALNSDRVKEILDYAEICVQYGMDEYAGLKEEVENSLKNLKNQTADKKIETLSNIIEKLNNVQKNRYEEDEVTENVFEREFIAKQLDTSRYMPGTTKPKEYDIEKNQFKIVGYYAGKFNGISSAESFILTKKSMENLGVNTMQGLYSGIIATNTGKGNVNALCSLLTKNENVIYTCKNATLTTVMINKDFFSNLALLFLIGSIVFAVFSLVMFANFISASIKNKYGEIGILRALGARGFDIMIMFFVETITTALINALIAGVLSSVGCIFLNIFFKTYLNIYIPLASFGLRQILVISGLSIGVGVLSAIMPIMSISKQKPVETIRKAF